MKKLVLAGMAMVVGAVLAHAQGTINVVTTVATVDTNGTAMAAAGGTAWDYEVLDIANTAYTGTGAQANMYSLAANPTAVSLWTDSGVSGFGQNLHAGGINSGLGGNATAANWAAPTSSQGYNTAPTYDYYTVLGWNASAGNWATVSALLAGGSIPTWFGQTAIAYNYAGGSGLAATPLFGASSTGLAGSGGLPTTGALVLNTPEPTTLALAGMGGLAALFLRRRKA
jgi:PEP-CTERM motif